MEVTPEENTNYELFRDSFSEPILQRLAPNVDKKHKKKAKNEGVGTLDKSKDEQRTAAPRQSDVAGGARNETVASELSEFIEYLAAGIFNALPPELRTLSYDTFSSDAGLQDTYSPPLAIDTVASLCSTIPLELVDTFSTYLAPSSIVASPSEVDIPALLSPILAAYISSTTTAPPVYASTRTTACELCERDWINLTYHHLIPRSMHTKVLRRGWHPEWRLNSVAWLCRQCHSFVHSLATNEELAREYWNMELIRERDEVDAWVHWVGRIRWKKR